MKQMKNSVMAIIAAMIWGSAFVAQSVGAGLLPANTFNMLRSVIAVAVLSATVAVFAKIRREPFLPPRGRRKALVLGGVCCGLPLALATLLQQSGLSATNPGKAGFITALYIVLVPIFGLFLHKKVTPAVWVAVALAAVGLYFLCIKESFTLQQSDLLIILCAVVFAVQILFVDHFANRVDGLRLSLMQFIVMALFSAAGMLFEQPDFSVLPQCTVPLLVTGVLSSGVAYTLQILAQTGANPTVITLLLSLESVFAVVTEMLVLHHRPTGRELIGCLLMLCAVILAQLPIDKRTKKV